MQNFTFYKLEKEIPEITLENEILFPVREEQKKEIFGKGKVNFLLLIEELEIFLGNHPSYTAQYRLPVSKLLYQLGIKEGQQGNHQQAAYYFEKGLNFASHNLSLTFNYGVSLFSLNKKEEALTQFSKIIADKDVEIEPLTWILAGRIYAEKGNFQKAYELYKNCAHLMPLNDETYWNYLKFLEEKANPQEPKSTSAEEQNQTSSQSSKKEAPLFCIHCGKKLEKNNKFCTECGKKVS